LIFGTYQSLNRSDAISRKKVIGGILKPMSTELKSRYISLKDGQVMSEISKAKAKEESPDAMKARAEGMGNPGEILSIIADVSLGSDVCARHPAKYLP
jgi:DNA helicase-2/ATP-dependent DNA helicase PcrA